MENDGVDLSAGPDLSINPRRIVEEPINLAPQPRQNPAIGSGILGTNMAAPMSATAAAPENPLDAAEQQLIATRNKAMVGATNPVFNFWFEDQAKEKQKEVVDTNLKIQQIQQAKQAQQTNQALAKNMGLTRAMSPTAGPGDITEEALREWRENGNFDAYRGLHGAGQGARADLYMDEGVNALGKQAEKASNVVDQLNSAPTQAAYDSVRKMVLKDSSLSNLGMNENNVPKFKTEWDATRGTVTAKLNQAKQVVEQFNQKQAQLSQAVPIADEKVASAVVSPLQGSNGETFPNLKAVSLPGAGGAQGGLAQPGSKDLNNYGTKWSNSTPADIKVASEQLNSEQFKGVLGKYKTSKDFLAATSDDRMYTYSAGLAAINDKFGAVERNVAEGSKGSGTIGLTKQLEMQYGVPEHIANAYIKAKSEIASWVGNGSKGPLPKLSPQSIEGMKYVAQATYNQDKKELDRLALPAATAGYRGIGLDKLGVDKEIQEDPYLKGLNEKAAQQYRMDVDKYPAIIKGDRRVILPQDAKVPGMIPAGSYAAGLPKAETPATNQPLAAIPATPAAMPSTGGGGSPPGGPFGPNGGISPVAFPGGGGGPPGGNPSNPQRGVSPDYLIKTARIESGNEPDPWKAGAQGTSASGAFQFIKSTWDANKPPGAPARAADATPQQQTEAANNLTNKNIAALTKAGVPVNDTTAYVAHNLGAAGAVKFISAPDDAKARDVVGAEAANNNPLFFKGNPTVAEVKARYQAAMNPASNNKNPTAEQIAAYNASKESFAAQRAKMAASATTNAANLAPAVGGALGGIAGSAVSPVAGTAIGAGLGGAAGGAVKNYFNGTPENQTVPGYAGEMGKGVIAAAPMMIPGMGPAGMAARVAAGGASQAGLKAIEGGDTGDIIDAGVTGAAGSMIGEGAGIFGHALWSKFGPGPQKALMDAAKTLANEEPKIASASGKMVDNPAYVKAKQEIQSIGKDPDQVAHDTRAMQAGTPKGEALASRPGSIEAERIGRQEYQPIAAEIGAAGQGMKPKALPALTDGPLSTIRTPQNPNGTVPNTPELVNVAQHAEIAATAPAKSIDEKWALLGQTRSELLRGERDALTSTATDKSATAQAMRDIADSVRVQQEKVARALLPPAKADALIQRLETADKNYRRAMLAGAGEDGDIVKAIAKGGKEGREAQAAFTALSGNDPVARRMVNSLVEMEKSKVERYGVGAIVLSSAQLLHLFGPVGSVVAGGLTALKAKQMISDAMIKKGAGSQLTFKQILGNELRKENARKVGATIGANLGGQVAR